MWDFETDPEFQARLDWADQFITDELEPLDMVLRHPLDRTDPLREATIPKLQEQVREQGLWACHLGPELGGPGMGQVHLALLNELLGRSRCAPVVFGCQAPDSGNAEILARFGSPEQKERYLQPLLAGEIFSCFSMTEPHGGADPKVFTTSAVRKDGTWVINGEKWFSSHARWASFLIVVVVTDPDAAPYSRQSMLVVPVETPGVEILRNVGIAGQDHGDGSHAYIRFSNVEVPESAMLGSRGQAFAIAQTRLGGGRIHHCMRSVGLVRRAFDMMLERAVSRTTQGELLASKQLVQEMIAESWLQIESFRLLVLRTAWKIDQYDDYRRVRGDISAVKAMMPRVITDVASRALQVHGSLGVSEEMPFISMIAEGHHMGLADGPTEVHKLTLAKELVKSAQPAPDVFPSGHLPRRRHAAELKFASLLG